MKLNYSDIEFDSRGRVEVPELMLRTLHGDPIGLVNCAGNISCHIKLSEPSELKFDIPAVIDGKPNPIYDRVTGHKQIYTKHYGIYETMNPSTEDDGISSVKHVTAYSLEKALSHKRFFLEEGTYKFWDPVYPDDTVLGRILEKAVGWSAGYVSPTLWNIYRTYDQVDDELLNFTYNGLDEKYACCIVFDTYNMTISAYDRNVDLGTLPIYLDHDNLINELKDEEKSEELVTALRPYGADELSIRDVNPTGSPWIYDLTNFLENGDIPDTLANKWRAWESKVASQREYYIALISLRASTSARLISGKAKLNELNNELTALETTRNVIVQGLGLDPDSAELLTELANNKTATTAKQAEITAQDALCNELEDLLDADVPDSYAAKIKEVVSDLSMTNTENFTEEEYQALQHYFIESDLTEDTFVATDIDTTISGESMSFTSIIPFVITDTEMMRYQIGGPEDPEHRQLIVTFNSGKFSGSGSFHYGGQDRTLTIEGDIIGGTFESRAMVETTFSLHLGSIKLTDANDNSVNSTASNVMLTMHGNDHEHNWTDNTFTFSLYGGDVYITATVNDFQQFTVERQLYDFAVNELERLATYTYEFSVESGNFLFAREFEQFRNELELGKGIYLNVGGVKVVTPLIEIAFEFDDESKLDLIFSNRIKRHDPVNTLKDVIEKTYSTTRSIEAGKHQQGQVNSQASAVSEFMNSALDAAKNRVLGAANQSVVIDGAGIHIGEQNSSYQMAIVNNMIAMTDDNWSTVKLAAGLFQSPSGGNPIFGINAEVIAGKLIVGNTMILESEKKDGTIASFRFDGDGAQLHNADLSIFSATGSGARGRIDIGASLGIVGGKTSTVLQPSYYHYDEHGVIDGVTTTSTSSPSQHSYAATITDIGAGYKPDVNFWIDMNGDVYVAGKIEATMGKIGGFTISDNELVGGSGSNTVGLSGSTSGSYGTYAMWAGASDPANAPFWVMKNGNAQFSGTVKAHDLYYLDGGTYKQVIGRNEDDDLVLRNVVVDTLSANISIDAPTINGGVIQANTIISSPKIKGGAYWDTTESMCLQMTPYGSGGGYLSMGDRSDAFAIRCSPSEGRRETSIFINGNTLFTNIQTSPVDTVRNGIVECYQDLEFHNVLLLTAGYGYGVDIPDDSQWSSEERAAYSGMLFFVI